MFAANGYLYVLGNDDGTCCNSSVSEYGTLGATGTITGWTSTSQPINNWVGSHPVVNAGRVYIGGSNNEACCGSTPRPVNCVESAALLPGGGLGPFRVEKCTPYDRIVTMFEGNDSLFAWSRDESAGTNHLEAAAIQPDGTLGSWLPVASGLDGYDAYDWHLSNVQSSWRGSQVLALGLCSVSASTDFVYVALDAMGPADVTNVRLVAREDRTMLNCGRRPVLSGDVIIDSVGDGYRYTSLAP
jgi:hypothetical protein